MEAQNIPELKSRRNYDGKKSANSFLETSFVIMEDTINQNS